MNFNAIAKLGVIKMANNNSFAMVGVDDNGAGVEAGCVFHVTLMAWAGAVVKYNRTVKLLTGG